MSFGFFGIQFGWGLQMANMSAIYEHLGARAEDIPMLWLAAPVTGLIVQPVIGAMSDRTWTWLGRRRPYFLMGAIMSGLALWVMPRSSSLLMAATLLWILDASINVSMEPFRAFVADKLNCEQRTAGFVMQSFFIGLGASLSSGLPYILNRIGISGTTLSGIPLTVQYSFQIGGVVFVLSVLWTVLTSKESAPLEKVAMSLRGVLREIWEAARDMPGTMKQLAVVQMCTWLGLFCMWMFFGIATARQVFGAKDPSSAAYQAGIEWGGVCFSVYSIVCFLISYILPFLADVTSRKMVHGFSLGVGGLGLIGIYGIQDKYLLLLSMVGVGIAWASILSMPYAMVSGVLPTNRVGVYMGIFNFFIVLPELLAGLTLAYVVRELFENNPVYMVMLGGGFLLVGGLMVMWVEDGVK